MAKYFTAHKYEYHLAVETGSEGTRQWTEILTVANGINTNTKNNHANENKNCCLNCHKSPQGLQ